MVLEIIFWIAAYLGIAYGVYKLYLSTAKNMPKWEQIALSLIWILLLPLWFVRKITSE